MFVLGDRLVDPRDVDLGTCGMVLEKNGDIVATGAGAAVWGHPANAAAWLANTLAAFGIAPPKPARSSCSGALGIMVLVQAGDNLRVTIGGIGGCSVRLFDLWRKVMSDKIKCALIGPGNIGTDLLAKIQRSPVLGAGVDGGIDPSPTVEARERNGHQDHRRGRRRPAAAHEAGWRQSS